MTDEKRIRRAILPGSFDPLTVGHLDVIRRASALYDEVFLALLINPDKSYLFDLDTRVKIAEEAVGNIPNVCVVHDSGMLVDAARRLGCSAVIKGVRNAVDFEYEMKMAEFNRALAPEIETLFLPCDEKYECVSSTRVRELLEKDELDAASALLPTGAIDIIRNYRGNK